MKNGRPKINNPRTFIYKIRLNHEEKRQLDFLSNETGKSKSTIIRELISNASHMMYYGYNKN